MKGWKTAFIGIPAGLLLFICVFVLAWLFIPFFQTWIGVKAKDGSDIISFVLALLQLGGVTIIALVVILYLFLGKRYKFIFNGFKNASILIDVEKRPIDIDMLAQEELVKQFKCLYRSLEQYRKGERNDARKPDIDTLIKEPLFVNQYTKSEEEHLLDLAHFLPHEDAKDMVVELKNLIKFFQIGEVSEREKLTRSLQNEGAQDDLLRMIGESAPKEFMPLMKFIEANLPRYIIEATGHLQWRGKTSEPHHIGITLEFAGSFNETTIHTIWWRHSNDKAASASNKVVATRARRGLNNIARFFVQSRTATTKMPEITDCYIELLSPAMYWLALTLWEYNYMLHYPNLTNHQRAKLHYLLSTLYYAYLQEMHSAYEDFFWERAVEHLDQAIKLDPDWCKPYLYVTLIYSDQLRCMQGNEQHYKETLNSVLQRDNEFYQKVEGTKKRLESQIVLWPLHAIKIHVPSLARRLHSKKIREASLILRKLIVAQVTTALNNLDALESLQVDTALATHDITNMQYADTIKMVRVTLQETIQKAGLIKDKTNMDNFLDNAMKKANLIKTMTQEEFTSIMNQAMTEGFKRTLEWLNDKKFNLGRSADGTYLYSLAHLYYLCFDKSMDVSCVLSEDAHHLFRESLKRSPELLSAAKKDDLFQEYENLEN